MSPQTAVTSAPMIDNSVLNVRPDPIDFRDAFYTPRLAALPTWYYPEPLAAQQLRVRNQGSEGSCTGHALAAVVDLQNITRFRNGADVPERVSPRMMYEMARDYDEFPDDDAPGSSARGTIMGFFYNGVCSTRTAPYFPGDIDWTMNAHHSKDARRVTLGAYFRLKHILNDYHAALEESQAIFCTAQIHDGWTQARVAQNDGRIIMPEALGPENNLGGHAFAIVGYDPEGFIVLNSWGEDWGGFNARAAAKSIAKRPLKNLNAFPSKLPGMAHWRYEDWSINVMDAWVLRLQVPTKRQSGYSGGWQPPAGAETPSIRPAAQPISAATVGKVRGHYIHVDDGRLKRSGRFRNSIETFEETARLLKEDESRDGGPRYDHLVFFAHGGLNNLKAGADRAADMVEIFKRNRVYPVFFLWRTGLLNIVGDLVKSAFRQASPRAGGITDFSDSLIEKIVRVPGKAIWGEMKADAHSACNPQRGGEGWLAAKRLIQAAQQRNVHQMKLHFIGHSAGALLVARLFEQAKREDLDMISNTGTLSLLAPAIDWSLFNKLLAPVARGMQDDAFSIYNLTDDVERDGSVAALYRKSLLYLVSEALETREKLPIVGLDKFWRDKSEPQSIAYHLAGEGVNDRLASNSRTHGGFDDDPATMNHVLNQITGRDPFATNPLGF